jgi:hypothetical protein
MQPCAEQLQHTWLFTLDGRNCGACAGPLLRCYEVAACVPVCGNEQAARVVLQAEARVSHLVLEQGVGVRGWAQSGHCGRKAFQGGKLTRKVGSG